LPPHGTCFENLTAFARESKSMATSIVYMKVAGTMRTLLRTLRHRNGSVIERLDLGIPPRKMSTSLMRNEGNGREEITERSSSLGDVDAVLSRCGSIIEVTT